MVYSMIYRGCEYDELEPAGMAYLGLPEFWQNRRIWEENVDLELDSRAWN